MKKLKETQRNRKIFCARMLEEQNVERQYIPPWEVMVFVGKFDKHMRQ